MSEEKQKRIDIDAKMLETFRKKHKRILETPFKNEDHVSEIVDTAMVRLGELNRDWFVYTPNGRPTGSIILHNRDCDANDKIRQYIYIGVADHVSDENYEEFEYDLDVMKLENLDISF